jgi:hypothetical protein
VKGHGGAARFARWRRAVLHGGAARFCTVARRGFARWRGAVLRGGAARIPVWIARHRPLRAGAVAFDPRLLWTTRHRTLRCRGSGVSSTSSVDHVPHPRSWQGEWRVIHVQAARSSGSAATRRHSSPTRRTLGADPLAGLSARTHSPDSRRGLGADRAAVTCRVSVWPGPRLRWRGFPLSMGRRARSRACGRLLPRSSPAIRMPRSLRCWRPGARAARRAVPSRYARC